MANPIDFPSLPTFSRLAAQLSGSGELVIAPSVIADCSSDLKHLPPGDRQRLEERGLIRDDLAGKLVQVLKVLAHAAEQPQVVLIIPDGDRWRFLAGARTTECNHKKECEEPEAVAGKTFALKGGQRGCCARWSDVTAVPDDITDFAVATRRALGSDDDAEIGVAVNLGPDTFDMHGQIWPPQFPPAPVD